VRGRCSRSNTHAEHAYALDSGHYFVPSEAKAWPKAVRLRVDAMLRAEYCLEVQTRVDHALLLVKSELVTVDLFSCSILKKSLCETYSLLDASIDLTK